jgi:hypothetical protein
MPSPYSEQVPYRTKSVAELSPWASSVILAIVDRRTGSDLPPNACRGTEKRKDVEEEELLQGEWCGGSKYSTVPLLFFFSICFSGFLSARLGMGKLSKSWKKGPSLVLSNNPLTRSSWSRLLNQTRKGTTCSCCIFMIHIYAQYLFSIILNHNSRWL